MTSFREYINYSEKYLQMAINNQYGSIDWLLIPATILSWSAIESFVNNMLDDFSQVPSDIFTLHERALLLEKKIRFVDSGANAGKFQLGSAEYKKLGDKILFLVAKFGESNTNLKSNKLWQNFINFKSTRDNLVHPRRSKDVNLSIKDVEKHIVVSKEIIDLISFNVWKKKIDF